MGRSILHQYRYRYLIGTVTFCILCLEVICRYRRGTGNYCTYYIVWNLSLEVFWIYQDLLPAWVGTFFAPWTWGLKASIFRQCFRCVFDPYSMAFRIRICISNTDPLVRQVLLLLLLQAWDKLANVLTIDLIVVTGMGQTDDIMMKSRPNTYIYTPITRSDCIEQP